MESEAQVAENAALFATSTLDDAALEEIARTRPSVSSGLLDPALWPKAAT
jgi:hypothetical protein